MKLLSFNVRGLGGWEKRREVQRLVREKNPFVFLYSGDQVIGD